ncbi:MAG: acetoacetate--CoA ligase [Alphaproteobacteria bacterium]|nr:acetoacetate--CoA ligase [Alphaproteobacteria bacterium]
MADADFLWDPGASRIAGTRMMAFLQAVNLRYNLDLNCSSELHEFSVRHPVWFWCAILDFCGIISSPGETVTGPSSDVRETLFFPGTSLNYAENLLRRRDESAAIIFRGEDRAHERISWYQLYERTSRLHAFFLDFDLKKGDRVAAVMPNIPQTLIAMLSVSAQGAIWSSCSPDFGEAALLERFRQIDPRVLIVSDGYYYKGKKFNISDAVVTLISELSSLEKIIIVPYLGHGEQLAARIGDKAVIFDDVLATYPSGEIDFVLTDFNDPLYILYSSGTTGAPKCIVHSAGGVLIQHVKEHQLHCDLRPNDRLFYFTTCGWMMWNWMVSALASEVTLLLYDGSPFYPNGNVLFDYICDERVTCFGTSAKFIASLKNEGVKPSETHDLSNLSTILSTGSPLVPESFDYVYQSIKKDVHLASVSGGTDICGCFVMGDPTRCVYRGEIQGPALGMDVGICDEKGCLMESGKGELVCMNAFPSMPVMFWNDSDGSRYSKAYFDRFPGIWHQGDFAEWTVHGGMIIHGRSDTTLNPGGVRLGTSEIYAQIESMPQIEGSVVIGQEWDHDIRVILFVKLALGYRIDAALKDEICHRIRSNLSRRHVPAKILPVADIPCTRSGKISELAVKDIVHGREFTNPEVLINPGSLDFYRSLPELRM